WCGKPKETYDYNPAKAKELLKQAGFDGGKRPAKAVHLISTSGSGQMLPLAMNELIQKNLKDVGIDVDLQPVEWNTLLTRWRAGCALRPARAVAGALRSECRLDPAAVGARRRAGARARHR